MIHQDPGPCRILQSFQIWRENGAKYFCLSKQRYCIISAHSVGECPFHMYISFDIEIRMSLATCSRFFRPCLSRIRPALSSTRLSGCRLYSSLGKRPNFVAGRLLSRHASDASQSTALLGENGLLVLGFSLLGGSLFYVSISLKLFFQW